MVKNVRVTIKIHKEEVFIDVLVLTQGGRHMPKEEGSHILDTEWVLMVICNMNANVRCEVLT